MYGLWNTNHVFQKDYANSCRTFEKTQVSKVWAFCIENIEHKIVILSTSHFFFQSPAEKNA